MRCEMMEMDQSIHVRLGAARRDRTVLLISLRVVRQPVGIALQVLDQPTEQGGGVHPIAYSAATATADECARATPPQAG